MSREAAEGQGGPRALAWTRLTYLLATPQLTQGDLTKALSPVAGGLHGKNPLGEGFCGGSPASAARVED